MQVERQAALPRLLHDAEQAVAHDGAPERAGPGPAAQISCIIIVIGIGLFASFVYQPIYICFLLTSISLPAHIPCIALRSHASCLVIFAQKFFDAKGS